MKHFLLTVFSLLTFAVVLTAAEYPTLYVPENAPAPGVEFALWQSIDHVFGENPAFVQVRYTAEELLITCYGTVREMKIGKGRGPYAIFGGCTAEIFLQPDPEIPVYYQLAISPDNRLYQAKGGDCTWKPSVPIKTVATVDGNAWKADFVIPFAALGKKTPVKGEHWKANFVFGQSWSPTSDYHDVSQFGTLLFGENGVPGVDISEFTCRDGVVYIKLVNRADSPAEFVIVRNNSVSGTEVLEPGKPFSTSFRIGTPTTYKGIQKISVEIKQNGKLSSYSALVPMQNPENGGLEKFYYRPGELSGTSGKGDYLFGTATAVVTDEFPALKQQVGSLSLENGLFRVDGIPFYPVVGSGKGILNISGCLASQFVTTPFTGAVFSEDPVIQTAEISRLSAKSPATLFRLQYESQLNIMVKDAAGKIRLVNDQISFYEKAYKKLKAKYPNAVFSIQADGAASRKERIARCCDVFEYASWGTSYAPAPLAFLDEELSGLFAEANGKPVIFWLGSFKAHNVNRGAEELRAAVWLCLIRGCAGNVLHLGHGNFPKEDKHAYDMLAHLQEEINSFFPLYAAGKDVSAEFSLTAGTARNPWRFSVHRTEKEDWLVAVNTSPEKVRFDLKHGNRQLVSQEAGPYAVRVFSIPR